MYLIKLLNAIKINTLNKKKYFYYTINKNDIKYLKKLLQINLISGVKFLKKRDIKVYLSYIGDKPIYKNVKLLYKPSNKFIVNLKTLQKINKYKNVATYLLFTNKGFITNSEAIFNRTGGILFCKLN